MTFLTLPAAAVAAHVDDFLTSATAACPDLSGHLDPLRRLTAEPPRVLVTGSSGTGISTLVEALTGTPYPETGGTVATVYSSADRAHPTGIPDTVQVRRIPGAALADLTFVVGDDPAATACADAVLYLVDREPLPADLAALRDAGFGPRGTVLLVSRADEFGAGSLGSADPVEDARAYARSLTPRPGTASSWSASVAVSPLLAVAGRSVAVDPDAAGRCARLASYRPAAVSATLLRGEVPAGMATDLDATGTYGVLRAGAAAEQGPATLSEWLTERSGVGDLRSELLGPLAQAALLRRAALVLEQMEQLRFTAEDPAALTAVLERPSSSPAAWRIRLFPEIARRAAAGMDDEAALVARVVDADSLTDLARLPAGAAAVDVVNGLREQLRTVNLRLTGFTVPVVEAAYTAVSVVLRRAVAEAEAVLGGIPTATEHGLWEN